MVSSIITAAYPYRKNVRATNVAFLKSDGKGGVLQKYTSITALPIVHQLSFALFFSAVERIEIATSIQSLFGPRTNMPKSL